MFESIEPNHVITEQNVLHPVATVLEEVTSQPIKANPLAISPTTATSIQDLFPEQVYDEKSVQKAKEILGDLAKEFSPQELKDTVVQMQFLIETWLDDFEREIFDGLSLRELLHEKGGL